MSRRPAPPPVQPWTPPEPPKDVVMAVKAVAAGVANDGQQKLALDWIIREIAGTYDLPFRPGGLDGDRATAFASGKQYVGQQIVRLINFDMSKLPKEPHERRR